MDKNSELHNVFDIRRTLTALCCVQVPLLTSTTRVSNSNRCTTKENKKCHDLKKGDRDAHRSSLSKENRVNNNDGGDGDGNDDSSDDEMEHVEQEGCPDEQDFNK